MAIDNAGTISLEDISAAADSVTSTLSSAPDTHVQAADKMNEAATLWLMEHALELSLAVLGFSIIVLILAAYLVKTGIPTESVLRLFGTILIITCAVFLVVAGFSSNQMAPVIGLLGTLAGYLLGRHKDKE